MGNLVATGSKRPCSVGLRVGTLYICIIQLFMFYRRFARCTAQAKYIVSVETFEVLKHSGLWPCTSLIDELLRYTCIVVSILDILSLIDTTNKSIKI